MTCIIYDLLIKPHGSRVIVTTDVRHCERHEQWLPVQMNGRTNVILEEKQFLANFSVEGYFYLTPADDYWTLTAVEIDAILGFCPADPTEENQQLTSEILDNDWVLLPKMNHALVDFVLKRRCFGENVAIFLPELWGPDSSTSASP